MTFILNCFKLLTSPQILKTIVAIMKLFGPTQAIKILAAILEAAQAESQIATPTQDEPARVRLVQRVLRRLALRNLNITEGQYAAMQNVYHNRTNSDSLA